MRCAASLSLHHLPPNSLSNTATQDVFPLHPDHPYRPKKATLDDLLDFEAENGIAHVCLIAFSVYGTDNRSILDALTRLKGKGRAVVAIDPDTISYAELNDMHKLGVRGVRMNLHTTSVKPDYESFVKTLRKHADAIRPLGWVLQLFISFEQIALIGAVLPTLGVPIVIDHLGHPEQDRPPREQKGYALLMSLLEKKQAYVKLSGTYRFSKTPGLEEYAREVLRIAPSQVVWASDWPHSSGVAHNPGGDRNKVQDYRIVDDPGFVATCKKWCGGNEELIRKIWVENPRRLWQYEDDD
jgi:predicted TIM-barrel fold metal-dependent hydrolase